MILINANCQQKYQFGFNTKLKFVNRNFFADDIIYIILFKFFWKFELQREL